MIYVTAVPIELPLHITKRKNMSSRIHINISEKYGYFDKYKTSLCKITPISIQFNQILILNNSTLGFS